MSRHQQNLTEAIHGQVLSRWKRELLWKQSIPQNYANSYYFITNVFYWDLRQGCCLETLLASYLFSSLKSCQFAQQSLLVLYGVSEKVMLRLWHLLGNKGRFKKKKKVGLKSNACALRGSRIVSVEQCCRWVPPASSLAFDKMVKFHLITHQPVMNFWQFGTYVLVKIK